MAFSMLVGEEKFAYAFPLLQIDKDFNALHALYKGEATSATLYFPNMKNLNAVCRPDGLTFTPITEVSESDRAKLNLAATQFWKKNVQSLYSPFLKVEKPDENWTDGLKDGNDNRRGTGMTLTATLGEETVYATFRLFQF